MPNPRRTRRFTATTMTTPTPEPGIHGLILAGGQSTRMGRDKAALRVGEGTLLAHMQGLLLRAGAVQVWVSGNYPDFNGIPDRTPGLGPLGGLSSALDVLPDGPLWVVPVDMPALTPTLLHQLRDAPPAESVIFAEYPLPMRLNVNAACRILLRRMIDDVNGPRSVRALQRRLGVVEIPVPATGLSGLANCNTPQQWRDVVA